MLGNSHSIPPLCEPNKGIVAGSVAGRMIWKIIHGLLASDKEGCRQDPVTLNRRRGR
jgi:hypothetical protein